MSALNDRELATVLAALRHWQWSDPTAGGRPARPADAELGSIATDGGAFPPLTAAEIDDLCERLNADAGVPARPGGAVREALRNVLHYNWAEELEDARGHLRENGDLTGHVFADLVALDDWLHGTAHPPESYLSGEEDPADPCCRVDALTPRREG